MNEGRRRTDRSLLAASFLALAAVFMAGLLAREVAASGSRCASPGLEETMHVHWNSGNGEGGDVVTWQEDVTVDGPYGPFFLDLDAFPCSSKGCIWPHAPGIPPCLRSLRSFFARPDRPHLNRQ